MAAPMSFNFFHLTAFLTLAIPATMMTLTEMTAWEALVLMGGWLPNPDLAVAVQGLAFKISTFFYYVPMVSRKEKN
jgi:Na+-driven multidrug efflux pump